MIEIQIKIFELTWSDSFQFDAVDSAVTILSAAYKFLAN